MFIFNMVLSSTYGYANIVVRANSLMLYTTKKTCVFVSIYLIAVNCCTYIECRYYSICYCSRKYVTTHCLQQVMHDEAISHIFYKFLHFHHIFNTSTCVYAYMHTCVQAHMHGCTCANIYICICVTAYAPMNTYAHIVG